MARSFKGNKSRKQKPTEKRRRDSNKTDARFKENDARMDRREGDFERNAGRTSSLNDLSWYSRNPQLLIAAGQFPYPYRPGLSLPLLSPTAGKESSVFQPTIPGIMALDWMPSFGNSMSSLDPASIAGKEFYGRVRAAFSGSIDADAPDFLFYIGALDSIFAYIGWLKRVYRTISSYTPDNLVLPEGMLRAYGFLPKVQADLREQKVLLWQGINELILKSRKFKCPAVMDLFNRHYWMSDNVYADSDDARAQLYIFNLVAVYVMGDVTEQSSGDTITGLVAKAIPRNAATGKTITQTLISFGNSMIEALDAWDDGYLISGYLQRAFQDIPSFTVAELLQQELLTVSYVPEVLAQIENSKAGLPYGAMLRPVWGDDRFSGAFVTQNVTTNAVVCSAAVKYYIDTPDAFAAMSKFARVNPMLNIRSTSPTVAENVIASRLHSFVEYSAVENSFTIAKFTAGTELPLAWAMIMHSSNDDTWQEQAIWNEFQIGVAAPTSDDFLFTRWLFNLGQFDWHPLMYVLTTYNELIGGIAGNVSVSINGDIHNPTVISTADLANLHKICEYSELNSFGI